MNIATSIQTHKNEDMLDFRKVKVQNHYSLANLNIPTELVAFPVFLVDGKNALADPKSEFFFISVSGGDVRRWL